MAANQTVTRPENMLPIMIVLGIMFIGICIAMNLFSRARFKKRTNVFAVAGRAPSASNANFATQTRPRSARGPGSIHRLESNCPTPTPNLMTSQHLAASSSKKSSTISSSTTTNPNNFRTKSPSPLLPPVDI